MFHLYRTAIQLQKYFHLALLNIHKYKNDIKDI
jgi:hypothetical protein